MCKSIVYAPNRVSIDQALIEAGLEAPVAKREVYDAAGAVIPGMFRIARVDNGATVGINKGSRYNVIQHFEAIKHGLGNVTDSVDGQIVSSVLNLYRGRLAVVTVDVAESGIIGGDSVTAKISIFSDHGDGGFGGLMSEQRPVCVNTYRIATAQAIALGKYIAHRHTGDVIAKARNISDVLGLAKEAHNAFVDQARHLAGKPATTEDHRAYFERLFQIPTVTVIKVSDDASTVIDERTTQQRNMLEKLFELSETGKGSDIPGVRGSYWGVVNAATEYDQHIRTRRGEDKADHRAYSALLGDSADLSVKAMDLAIAMSR